MTEPSRLELFHAISEAGSAAARRVVVERGLVGRIQFRNVVYPEVSSDLSARGGTATPALWDGERLHEGTEAVLTLLGKL